MKILVVSNYYPPWFIGGYELGCREVVKRLAARGHTVRVLTSTYGVEQDAAPEPGVDRLLALSTGAGATPSECGVVKQCGIFRGVAKEFSPDVVYFWNQTGLCLWLSLVARLMGLQTAFFISDASFTAWRVGAFLLRFAGPGGFIRRGIRAMFGWTWLVKGYPVVRGRPCHFVSAFLRNFAHREWINVSDTLTEVIHWGTDVERFRTAPAPGRPRKKLLYVGQVIPQKGVHTVVEALAILAKKEGFGDMSLTVAGGTTNPEYEERLRALPTNLGISENVNFLGKVEGAALPEIYRAHDVLVFPSMWDEPFAITPLEAMASMLPVAGTTTGGSAEIFFDRDTAMTFEAGNAAACAAAVTELCADRELYESIRARAFKLVAKDYTLDGMTDRIEAALKRIASGDKLA